MLAPSRIRLDDVACFAAFADAMSFSAAARQLNISQPALHVKVRKLGEDLGVPLYRRRGRQLELTPQGEIVARMGREMRTSAQELADRLHLGAAGQPVILAAGTGAYMYLLGPPVHRYLRDGKAPLRLLTLDRDGAIAAVLAGRAHLAIAPLDTVPAELEAEPLARVGQVLVAPKDHPLARKRRVQLSDLEGANLVVPSAGQPHREMLARLLQSAGVRWNVAVEATGWELIMQFVKLGVGLSVVNAYCTPPKGLVAVDMPELPTLSFCLVRLKGQRSSDAASRLRLLLLQGTQGWRR